MAEETQEIVVAQQQEAVSVVAQVQEVAAATPEAPAAVAPPAPEVVMEVAPADVVADGEKEDKVDDDQTTPGVKRDAPSDSMAAAADAEETEAPKADAQPAAAKKPRITRATIGKYLRKGKLLENQMFTWRDWSPLDENEQSDVLFTGCKMKIEVKNAEGKVVLAPKQSVRRIEMYTSKSMIVFYPEGSIAGSIICPLQISVLTPVM